MDANFGPDVSEDGAGKPESPKNKIWVSAVALGALVGLGVGVGAFGAAAAMQDGNLFGASSEEPIAPTTSEEPPKEERPEPTLVRETETTTESPTPTTITSTRVHEAGQPSSSTRSRSSSDDEPRTSSDGDGRRIVPSVVPEQVLRPITTTSTPSRTTDEEDGAGDESTSTSPSTSTTATSNGQPDNGGGDRPSATQTTTVTGEREGEDDDDRPDEQGNPSQVPTDDSETPAQPIYPTDATNAELDAQLRAATSNATPNEDRVRRFEQGRAAQPVINMMTTLTSGSVSPISWEFVGPVRVTEGRAETRMRIFTPFPTERPAIFVWRDGEWKISRETTCELATVMFMACPA